MSPRLVMFAYFFPPVGGVAVRRTLGFLQRLDEMGWELGVVTPEDPAVMPKDPAGLARIPGQVEVLRTRAWEPQSYKVRTYLLVPDQWVGWAPFAVRAARRWAFAREAAVLYASAPPYSALMAVRSLARSLKIPYVVDLRDPWSINLAFHRGPVRARIERALERRVLRDAAAVIVNTPETAAAYLETYPWLASSLTVIPNGYDHLAEEPGQPGAGPLTLVHTGSLAGSRLDAAVALLDGVAAAFADSNEDAVRIRFVGLLPNAVQEALQSHPAGRFVEIAGFVPHDDVVAELENADVLLLLANTEDQTALHVPAKLYEYMATKRPVLAIAGEGGIRRVVSETGIGSVVPAGDSESLRDELLELARRKREGVLCWDGDPDAVARYDRTSLAAHLDELLRSVIAERGR